MENLKAWQLKIIATVVNSPTKKEAGKNLAALKLQAKTKLTATKKTTKAKAKVKKVAKPNPIYNLAQALKPLKEELKEINYFAYRMRGIAGRFRKLSDKQLPHLIKGALSPRKRSS